MKRTRHSLLLQQLGEIQIKLKLTESNPDFQSGYGFTMDSNVFREFEQL